jgi:hypothetical protein
MGEMADFDLEEVECFEDLRTGYSLGQVSLHEAYEAGIVDDNGFYIQHKKSKSSKHVFEAPDPPSPFKVCKYCGAGGLIWVEHAHGWRLSSYRTKEPHVCDAYHRIKFDELEGGE